MANIVLKEDELLSLMAGAAVKRFKDKLEGYNSPLDSIVEDAFKVNAETIRKAVYKATTDCVNSPSFGEQLVQQLNHKLATLVISKCSGLVEKSFNAIMQDPILRNKLQSAVIDIIERETK